MAHEIGHSLGLHHDPEGCCVEANPEQGGCVMEAATGYAPKVGVTGPGRGDGDCVSLASPQLPLYKVRVIPVC